MTSASSSTNAGPTATLDLFQSGDGDHNKDVVLEGTLTGSGGGSTGPNVGGPGFNTLDEPIKDTVLRDVRAVGNKFYHVLYPVEKKSLLKEWDLWGPLILCTFMAVILQGDDQHGGPEFAEVFVVVWAGALVVTLNTKLLGGNISLFQSVCVLGYCLLPLAGALGVCRLALAFASAFLLRCVVVTAGFVWASYASMQFLGDCQPHRRKALAAYPMFLFYFLIAWMVISHHN